MPLSYTGANLGAAAAPDLALVRDLQRDLRALGYLYRNIDGQFGQGTRAAIRRLQFDLLHNNGGGTDGSAPVAITQYNRGVSAVTGVVDQALAESIEALLADSRVTRLPDSHDPKSDNRVALQAVASFASPVAPTPYILAIFQQESSGQHYAVPRPGDSDSFITIGLDTNAGTADQVTSRGYGLGQYTLFHHPPRADEVRDLMMDPVRNAQRAYVELREKFDRVVAGPADTADDRKAEHPILAMRVCRYGPSDARFMRACRDCAREAGKLDINAATPLYAGSAETYGQASYYPNPFYAGVPNRAEFLCDWPYATRRYNGSGPNSFNYQARILLNLLAGPSGIDGATA